MFPGQFQKFKSYSPKKPVKSFQDLEVYQKSLEASVFVAKTLVPAIKGTGKKAKATEEANKLLTEALLPTAMGLPHLIAEAHSLRFGSSTECLLRLEKVMMNCNKLVVYVEQTRDISETGIEWEQFDELVKKYLYIRRKVLNLQRSWQKFININKSQK